MVRRISSSLRGGSCPEGRSWIGWRILIGIDFISISYRLNAISTLSSHVSPIPMIPPEQTARPGISGAPDYFQLIIICMCGTDIWEIPSSMSLYSHDSGKFRLLPACRSPSWESSPWDAHSSILQFSFMLLYAPRARSISWPFRALPAVTTEYLPTPVSHAFCNPQESPPVPEKDTRLSLHCGMMTGHRICSPPPWPPRAVDDRA